jgi:hypothetical protein
LHKKAVVLGSISSTTKEKKKEKKVGRKVEVNKWNVYI